MGMSTITGEYYYQYLNQQAKLNNARYLGGSALEFSVDPVVQQRLEKAKMESSPFLKEVNSFGVTDQEGEKVSVSVKGPIASTNTSTTDRRQPQYVYDESAERYRCEQTNFDTGISYTYLDMWAGNPKIFSLIGQQIAQQCANDRLIIGFNGVERVAKSNKTDNPLLQDVNKGWLQHIRERASHRVMSNITMSSFDETGRLIHPGTYANPDAVVYDAKNSLLDPWHRQAPGLVAIVGSNLLTQKNFKLINQHSQHNPNMEMLAGNELLKLNSLGGIPVIQVPFFPDGTILITTLKNLSIYWMKGKERRTIQNEPHYNRIAIYSSSNEGYVVEDYGLACLIEGLHYAQPEGAQPATNTVTEGV